MKGLIPCIELLDREIFTTLLESKVLIERWRKEYNQVRPHSSLAYWPPAPEAVMPVTLAQGVVPFMGAGQLLSKEAVIVNACAGRNPSSQGNRGGGSFR
jgi:hypothetical protein